VLDFYFAFSHANERAEMYLKAFATNWQPGGSTRYGWCLLESTGNRIDEL